MKKSLDGLSLSEEWEARSNSEPLSLLDSGFIDRLAKAGEQSRQAADAAAKTAGFDAYWDWISLLSKRVSVLDGDRVEKAFQRFFRLRLSLDAVGAPQELAAEDVLSLAQILDGAQSGPISLTTLGLLGSLMGTSDPLPSGSREGRRLRKLAADFSRKLAEGKEEISPLVLAQSFLGLLLVESLCKGRAAALETMLKRFELICGRPLILLGIGRLLYFSGVYDNFPESAWRRFLAPGKPGGKQISTLSALLYLALEAPPEWAQKLFFDWLSPNIHHALEGGDFSRAEILLKQTAPCSLSPYSVEHEMEINGDYLPALEDNAAKFKDTVSALPLAQLRAGGELRVAIVTTAPLDWGTPIRLALLLLHGVARHCPGQFRFFLYSPFGVQMHDAADMFETHGVTVRWLEDSDCPPIPGVDPLVSRFVYLRNELARENIDVAVFFRGSMLHEALYSQLRLAPIQVYWSMGFDWPPYRNMDGFLSCVPKAGLSQEVNGQPWNWYRLLYHTLPEASEAEVARLKEKYVKGRFVFGVLCQSFKLDCEDFIQAVAEILKGTPDSIFIWTGSYKPYNVTRLMKRHGIEERCVFIGWVHPKDGHRIIDVFLDTFPMGNGSSSAEAMSLSKPVVSLAGAYLYLIDYFFTPAEKGWFGEEDQKKFREITCGGGYILCDTLKDYVAEAVRLAHDRDYRDLASRVSHSLAHEFLFNKESSAHSFIAAIKDIVNRVRGEPSGAP